MGRELLCDTWRSSGVAPRAINAPKVRCICARHHTRMGLLEHGEAHVMCTTQQTEQLGDVRFGSDFADASILKLLAAFTLLVSGAGA